MAQYVDGFAHPIPRAYLEEYAKVATAVAEIWKEHGALAYHEYVGDDMSLQGTRSFIDAVDAKEDDVVLFGWVAFDSRESRDEANKLVASDPRMQTIMSPLGNADRMIFDASRMLYGGFDSLVQ